jgi:formiminoglutamase
MNIFDGLIPIAQEEFNLQLIQKQTYLAHHILPLHEHAYQETEGKALAIFGISDYRSIGISDSLEKPLLAFRKAFYGLHHRYNDVKVFDGGNTKPGKSLKDTFTLITEISMYCKAHGIIPVFLGGTQDLCLAFGNYFKKTDSQAHLCMVDAELDLNSDKNSASNKSFIHEFVKKHAAHLNNIAVAGLQSYFVDARTLKIFNDLQFDAVRLGMIKQDLTLMEPMLRDANAFVFDSNAIQQSFIPSNSFKYVNGLSAEDACAILRYAGMSNQLEVVGLFEWQHLEAQEMMVFAQMLWYFIEGLHLQVKELPSEKSKHMEVYHCISQQGNTHLSFLKSTLTGKWWIKVPYPRNPEGYVYVPCNKEDYQEAMQGEVPDRWWKMLNKLA